MSITLQNIWIHDANDLEDLVLVGANSQTQEDAVLGERRRRANGRFVSVTTVGTEQNFSIELPAVSRANYDWIVSKVGLRVLFRDTHGRMAAGVYYSVASQELLGFTGYASITFELEVSGDQTFEV